jgi:hypothetical protein
MSDRVLKDHPATVFLSYRRKDTEEVGMLQQQLYARGVRAQRDITDMLIGTNSKEEITRIIEQECDAFLLYATPDCLESEFIWRTEVPSALKCRSSDPNYGIIPVLYDVSPPELSQTCRRYNTTDLAEFNAIVLPKSEDGQNEQIKSRIRGVATRVLKDTLNMRLRRASTDTRTYEPFLCLHTDDDYTPPEDHLDLDLNWRTFFKTGYDRRWPSEQEWQEILLPALNDVKSALIALPHSRTLHLNIHARLPVAFALGTVFSRTTRFNLVVEGGQFPYRTDETLTDNEEPLDHKVSKIRGGDKHIAIVEVSISRPVTIATSENLSTLGISPGYRAQLEVKGGARIDSVKNSAHALAMARQFGQEIRNLYDKGVRQFHLFISTSAPLAVLLGHQMNAVGTLIVYQYVDSQYTPGCTLRS